MDAERLRNIVEAALLAEQRPLAIERLERLFTEEDQVTREQIRAALGSLAAGYEGRGIELKQVASGYRIQVRQELGPWLARLEEERPTRYSRALLETLALIAYRQPITRGEIEDIRGVSVSSSIMKTLLEREWVRVVGHRDVPGKPAMYGTTRNFLDYFNLRSLGELPPLSELRDLEAISAELEAELPGLETPAGPVQEGAAGEAGAPAPGSGEALGSEEAPGSGEAAGSAAAGGGTPAREDVATAETGEVSGDTKAREAGVPDAAAGAAGAGEPEATPGSTGAGPRDEAGGHGG